MPMEPPSFLTLRNWRPLFATSPLNRYESVLFGVFLFRILIHDLRQCKIQTKNVSVFLGQHGNFLWFQSSPRESLYSSGICLLGRVSLWKVDVMCSTTSDICFHSDLCSAHFWCMAFTSLCGSFVWEGSRTHSVASSSSPARLHSKPFLLFTWSAGESRRPQNNSTMEYCPKATQTGRLTITGAAKRCLKSHPHLLHVA